MAKLTAPLLSFDAKGQIGKTMVTANWRGVKYARQYVVPANPRTTAQQTNRTKFAFMREMYKLAPSIVRNPWLAFASGRPFTDYNKFVGENLRLVQGQTTLTPMLMSPGARGGLPPIAVAASPGAGGGEIDVDITVPTQVPDGWVISAISAAAVEQQDSDGIFTGAFVAETDAPAGNPLTLTGMAAATPCVAFGWVEYTKPDGSTAYSVSLSDDVTSG